MLILSVFNLIYLVTTIAAGEAVNIYLSPVGLPVSVIILLAVTFITNGKETAKA